MPLTGDRLTQEVKSDLNARMNALQERMAAVERMAGLDVVAQLTGITKRLDSLEATVSLYGANVNALGESTADVKNASAVNRVLIDAVNARLVLCEAAHQA
jgi:hypothetical protein